MNKLNIIVLVFFGSFLLSIQGNAQGRVKLTLHEMQVKGTSSLHDWQMDMKQMQVNVQMNLSDDQLEISQVRFKAEVKNLVSGNSMMDGKAQKALKMSSHPHIEFISSANSVFAIRDSHFSGTLKGELIIAGEKRPVELQFTGQIKEGNKIHFKGNKILDMKEFKIDPPTAMLGTVKTGKDVTVGFTIELLYQQ